MPGYSVAMTAATGTHRVDTDSNARDSLACVTRDQRHERTSPEVECPTVTCRFPVLAESRLMRIHEWNDDRVVEQQKVHHAPEFR